MNLSDYKINENGCWIWIGKTCANGRYGRVLGAPGQKVLMAHRASYEFYKEKIPDGMFVCHKCDNGLCVNPDHLFLGTHSDNQIDSYNKGRHNFCGISQKGEKNANAKLSASTVAAIREFHKNTGCSYRALAEHFGLSSKGHAYSIVKRLCW